MSSSPLPSPHDLLRQKPTTLSSGSRKAPVPQDAPTGFMSATHILLNKQLQAERESSIKSAEPQPREPSKTPSLDAYAYNAPDSAPEPAAAGKLKKPTKASAEAGDHAPKAKSRKKSASDQAGYTSAITKPAPKKGRKKAMAEVSMNEDIDPSGPKRKSNKDSKPALDGAEEHLPPAPKRGRKKQTTETTGVAQDAVAPAPKRTRKKATELRTAENAEQDLTNAATIGPEREPELVKARSRKTKVNASAQAQVVNDSALDQALPEGQPAKVPGSDVILISDSSPLTAETNAARTEALPLTEDQPSNNLQNMELEQASRRRLDWTPPRDFGLPPSFQYPSFEEDEADEPATTEQPADTSQAHDSTEDFGDSAAGNPKEVHFSNLMGNFGYQGVDTAMPESLPQGDSVAKPVAKRKRAQANQNDGDPDVETAPKKPRKKAEPKPKVAKAPKVPKAPKAPKVPKEPKPKAPKKAKSPKKKPLTITELSLGAYRVPAPQDPTEPPKLISEFFAQPADGQEVRGELTDGEASAKSAATKCKNAENLSAPKPRKSRKKVTIQEPVILTKLESPETAQRQLKEQEWLFGSSSQLVSTESPAELRDLQRALKESEEFVSTQRSEDIEVYQATSCARVPSAPHGTSLSIGQAQRDLWCSAARDFEDCTFVADEGLGITIEEQTEPIVDSFVEQDRDLSPQRQDLLPEAEVEAMTKTAPVIFILSSQTEPEEPELHDSGYVDIDDVLEDTAINTKKSDASSKTPIDIVSDTVRERPASFTQEPATISINSSPQVELHSTTHREILQPLDPNATFTNHASDASNKEETLAKSLDQQVSKLAQKVSVTTTSLAPSPEKKPRGRPRKTPATDATTSPKRRGRPPKSQAQSGPAPVASRPKIPKPSLSQLPPSSPYLDIDDISDDEVAAAPPSPPRRRASATFLQPMLELSNPAAAPPANPRTNKQLQADFPTIALTLFPQISATVKAAKPTRDPKTPSWYEKILLYDPIVLEDLTAWLNGEGVCIESSRPKVVKKGKGKGKQKEGQVDKGAAEEVELEMEVCREELKPWMVQKWCEDNSVCCLWKGGLRGGVRAAY